MSTQVGAIHYSLALNTKPFEKEADAFRGKLNNIGNSMKDIGKTMTAAVTLPVVAGFGYAIKSASDLNETINKVDVAFKDQADTVKQWATTSLTSMGLAQQSALDAAALFGDMSTAMGLSTVEARDMSTGLTQLGADMASFKNISFERAQVALAGVYTGETEALKSLGIVMTEANLEQFRLKKGIKTQIKDMTQAQKVQLRYAYVMDVTKNAQGDFARTAEGTANQMRMAQERFKEVSATIGQQLLPITNKFLGVLSQILERFRTLSPESQKIILIFLAIAAAVGPLLLILGQIITLGVALSSALSIGLLPAIGVLGGIVAGVVALAAVVAVVIAKWDTLKKWFAAFWDFIKRNWKAIAILMTGGMGALVIMFISNFSRIKNFIVGVWTAIRNTVLNVYRSITGWFGSLPDNLRKATSSIGNILFNPFKWAFNAIARMWNRTVGSIGFTAPDWVPGFGGKGWSIPDIPTLAQGGIVTKPTLAMIGEGGESEAVIPLSKLDKLGSTTNFNAPINIYDKADAEAVLRLLGRNQEIALQGYNV